MALINSRKLAQLCIKKHPILCTAIRNHWNHHYKPAPYPKTQEEREASAKKYGLLPEEYATFPENGTVGVGDYPNVPTISGDARDPNYPWDNPELKRNFNEPVHVDNDVIGEDRADVTFRHKTSVGVQFLQLFGLLFGGYAFYGWLEDMKMFPGLVPKQYPFQGKTHYTFETKE